MTGSTAARFTLDPATTEKIEQFAASHHRPAESVVREAIDQYLERQQKREQFTQDGLAAWSDYQATGLHATAAEVDAWLAKLEAGIDADAPECHG